MNSPDTVLPAESVEPFGYTQQLKRSLRPIDLLIYGLVFIGPIGPWFSFGFVFNASRGMVPLVYLVGMVAMMFTALSYMTMSAAFPVAGSVYAYAGRGIGKSVGFLAGWAILLDYLLSPALIYVVCAVAVQAVLPSLPKPVLVLVFLLFNTMINLSGIDGTARLSMIMLSLQLALLTCFMVLSLVALSHGVNGAHITITPLYDAHKLSPSLIFGGLTLAMVSFLGFDAISTLAEEAKGGAEAVGRATLLALILAATLFIAQTYMASLFVLDQSAFADGDESSTAFLTISRMVGGDAFRFVVSIVGILLAGLASAAACQAATARLVFSMARDRMLPRALSHVSARRQAPDRATVLVAAVTIVTAVSMVNHLELLTSMVSFGALVGFLALHLSVIVHFVVRERSKRWIRHLVVPAIGFLLVGYALLNTQANAKIAGFSWLFVGGLVMLGQSIFKRLARRSIGTATAI